MSGWRTGNWNRHPLAGVPTRPAKTRAMSWKKPQPLGAAIAPIDRVAKPAVRSGTCQNCTPLPRSAGTLFGQRHVIQTA